MQSVLNEFRKTGQILHLLPCFLEKDEAEKFTDPGGTLHADHRDELRKKYGTAIGAAHEKMPEELSWKNFDEITCQPLLNYLVALSYSRGKVDFSETTNLNAVYEDLLKAVYERGWAGHCHISVKDMDEGQFVRILEEIAVAAWHGEGRTTTVGEAEDHCEQSGLKSLLKIFKEGAGKGQSRLFIAFYFRQAGRRSDRDQARTFEFTHKSFGEYLTAS